MPSIILPDRGRAPETHEGWKIVQGDGVLEYEVSQCIEKCWRQISAKDQTELQDRAIEEHKDLREILLSYCGCSEAVPSS
jgi:hypothetical protein